MAYEAALYASRPCRPRIDTSILSYIADRSPQGAARIHARIRAVTDLLLAYPQTGAVTDDPTIRRMMMTPYPYVIFYEKTDAEIIIHAVRDRSRVYPRSAIMKSKSATADLHRARDPSDDVRSE